MIFPQIIETSEISSNTVESIRVVLIQNTYNNFILIMEGLKAPEFKSFNQIKPAIQIAGKEKALAHYNYIIHQLRLTHYAD